MKKFLGLLVVSFSLNSAMATSVMGTAIEYKKTNKVLSANPNHVLSVYYNGRVLHRTVSPQLPNGGSYELVAILTPAQMIRINTLLRLAHPVRRGFERSLIKCFAPSMFTESYSGENGTLFLKEGARCDGGYKVNERRAATKLVNVLDTLEKAAHSRANFALVESKLETLLAE